ncbi:hypothetical protein B0A51_05955 [Lecanosticta acicola]|uniref:AB hydrolase-1 domain-containing protein n=1 Tax=Lecanosticta acicola TaxID=111012 RepID=A0AAI9EDY5_9PEZI|nr:hypothetical protein B0A51_05955 [Lecanosticta acicola]
MPETQYFHQEITLSSQSSPPNTKFPAKLAYFTLGSSSNPAVLLPTCFGGTLASTSPWLYTQESAPNATGPILSTKEFFIIVTALLGGGESSSPSNTPEPWSGPKFPGTTYEDNIHLQKSLCDSLGIGRLFAYIGFSMGGQQAYHMATLYPDFVENMVCIAGSAKTSWHNWSFLEGPKFALMHSVDFKDGEYGNVRPRRGIEAFKRVYSTWALSQAWFRERCWRECGFESLEAYLNARWNGEQGDGNDLLALIWTWQRGDIGIYFPEDGGDLGKTLGRIKSRCLVMPVRTDMYFPSEDSVEEVKCLEKGELSVIESIWGHLAGGGGGSTEDSEFMVKEITRFLGV